MIDQALHVLAALGLDLNIDVLDHINANTNLIEI